MRAIVWIGIGVAACVALGVAASVAARFSDGPIAILAGGPLVAGPLVQGPEPVWSFARDLPTIEFQLLSPPRSRTTWILESGGKIYVPCGYMGTTLGRLWKHWPIEAERDGRAIARIAGKRYERQLVRVRDPALFEVLARELHRKYGAAATAQAIEDGDLWLFELAPRPGSGSESQLRRIRSTASRGPARTS
ncbi:MAG: hypothetical protein ACE5IL_14300 [Myxococcota bacterium]